MLRNNPPELSEIVLTEEEKDRFIKRGAILKLRFFSHVVSKIPKDFKKVKKSDKVFFDVKFEDESRTLIFDPESKKFGEFDDTKKSTTRTVFVEELKDFLTCVVEISGRYVRGGNPKSKKNVRGLGKVELRKIGDFEEGKTYALKFGDMALLNVQIFVDRSHTSNFVETKAGEYGVVTFSEYEENFKEICGERKLGKGDGFSMFNPENFDFMETVNLVNDMTQSWLNKFGRHFHIHNVSSQSVGGLAGYYGHKSSFRGLDATSKRTFNWCGRKAMAYNFTSVTYERAKVPSQEPSEGNVRVRSRIKRHLILENPYFNIELLRFQILKLPEKLKKIKEKDELIFNIRLDEETYEFVTKDMKRRGLELNKDFELADRIFSQKVFDIKDFPVEINVQYKRGKGKKSLRKFGTVSLSEKKDLLKYRQRNIVKIKVGQCFRLWARVYVNNPYSKFYFLQPRRFGRISFIDKVSSFQYGKKDLMGFDDEDFGLEKSVNFGMIELKKWLNGHARKFVRIIGITTQSCGGIGAYATNDAKCAGMNNMAYNVTTVWYQRNEYVGKIEDFERRASEVEPLSYNSPVSSPIHPQYVNEEGEEEELDQNDEEIVDLFREVPISLLLGRAGPPSHTSSLELPRNFDEVDDESEGEEEDGEEEEEDEDDDDDDRGETFQYPMMVASEPVIASTNIIPNMLQPVSIPRNIVEKNKKKKKKRVSSEEEEEEEEEENDDDNDDDGTFVLEGCGDISIRRKKKKKKKKKKRKN